MKRSLIAGLALGLLSAASWAGPGVVVGGPKFGNSPQSWNAPIQRTRAPIVRPPVRHPNWCGTNPRSVRPHHPGVITTGSGLVIDGRYRDDNLSLGLHLGGLYEVDRRGYSCLPDRGYYPARGYGWRYGRRSVYDGNYYAGWNAPYYATPVHYPAVTMVPPTTQVAPTPAPPPVPATVIEQAREALALGGADRAVTLYKEHLGEFHQDSVALRELGAALLEAGRLAEGIAVIREAYTMNPGLADEPLDGWIFGVRADDRLANLVRRVGAYANSGGNASPWLALTMLMQAQGRDHIALMNMVKGVDRGLDEAIANPLGDALRRKAYVR